MNILTNAYLRKREQRNMKVTVLKKLNQRGLSYKIISLSILAVVLLWQTIDRAEAAPENSKVTQCILNVKPEAIISTKEILENFSRILPVDCRSRLEFNVLHIEGAVHLPAVTMLKSDLERIYFDHKGKLIVFYSNGEA
jgi:hypothetical protein